MRKHIEKFKIAVLFLLLAVVAISPSLLISYQNRQHLEKVYIESYTAKLEDCDAFKSGRLYKKKYTENLTEKLLSLAGVTEGTQIIEQLETIDLQWERELLEMLSSELISLQELNAIPQFELHGSGNIYSMKIIKISNVVKKYDWIELIDMSVDYHNVSLNVLVDVETSLILDINVYSNSDLLSLSNIPFKNFAQYLGYENSYVIFESNNDIGQTDSIYGSYQILSDDLRISFYVSGNQEHFQYILLDATQILK